ncbi:MAG: hypothetical protein CMP76_08035 [Flavobacterium sp.]|uniref:carboxypeptidase-like regulatory domain-containing protein n=1 Tax=Flavobacterium sp. TaxID=239 RepID=UPI000C44E9A9|nr:carboxypeptidase-like regulatory domain-containing protein [Flavobacterium sp.]MBF03230.1 hypothetical protein [Flavobacterium sp.]|tara:strand:+ start:642 stop:1040 length:399 start_codon:yes stop_codon:yes gene_type:complete
MLIKGKVTDYNGEPIHLASVSIKGSNPLIGVSTDFDGNYAINVNVGQTLEFSYVGNQQPTERLVRLYDSIIDVTMANQLNLDEIVINGKKPTNYFGWILGLIVAGFIIKSISDISKEEKKEKEQAKVKKVTI